MSGIFFLIFLGGVILIIAWSVKMERLPPGARTSGLLAMREPPRPEDEAAAAAEAASRPPGSKRRVP